MTLLSLCLAAASLVSAQTAPAPTLQTYQHTAKKATLVVITPAGADRPAAVYYEGEKGRWLVRGSDLRVFAHNDGWAPERRYDIYWLEKSGLNYQEDSYSDSSARAWTDPSAVAAVEDLAAKLSYANGLKEAPLDCLTRVSEAGKQLGSAEGYRSGLATAESLAQCRTLTPERLPEIKAELDAARAVQARAKAACETASKEAFSGAAPEKTAPLFLEAVTLADQAAGAGAAAQRELDGMRIPSY